jgi:tetratricopeptide (TPR) repeat protein
MWAMGHWVMGQYDEAIEAYKKALHRKHMFAHVPLTASYSLLGRDGEARAEAAEVLRIYPKFSLQHYSKESHLKIKPIQSVTLTPCARRGLKEGKVRQSGFH